MNTSTLFHTQTPDHVLSQLQSSPQGLSSDEAAKRLKENGPNELKKSTGVSPWALLFEQFKNVLVIILLIATVLSGFLGHEVEAITIAVIVLLAVVLGFVQEFRAEKAMEALKSMAAPTANVIRGGEQIKIPANELVIGDIILLAAGDRVPADARIIEQANLRTDEASLTGESLPSEKDVAVIANPEAATGDRKNMVYGGTSVAHGRGKAVVTGTGMQTEFGKIAAMLSDVKTEQTPLQQNLDRVGKTLAKMALGVVVVISIIGWYRGESLIEIVIFGIALAVAVVPEALPAVVTISLAIGVQRMVRRHALIRRLPAVETLGCTSVICTDKTGTLTKDEMTVREIFVTGKTYQVSGSGYAPTGSFMLDGNEVEIGGALKEFFRGGVLSSDAKLTIKDGVHDIIGDPTEGAIVVAAAKAGILKEKLDAEYPRIGEIPFSSETKRMTTLHKEDENNTMAYTKGAPEMMLPHCTRMWGEHGEVPMTESDRKQILDAAAAMAKKALRVLAIARKGDVGLDSAQQGMKFLGLVGMIDPPRPEAKAAIATCKTAGIKVVMITGDHPVTAEAIARELGIAVTGKTVTGAELEAMDDAALVSQIDEIEVYARVSPAHKLRIVTALQAQGEIVAMTGDGVNDAPALKKADIGVAMGITGTDVSKEAAAMTLTDDNFASIVAAVEEGRGIFGNIKKYLMYLLSSNIGEIIIMTVATLLGWPLPLSAVQLLYLNLATDGFPAVALAVDPPEKDLMRTGPRDPHNGIFTRRVLALMLTGSVWLAVLILGVFWWAQQSGRGMQESMTMAFVLLVVCEFVKSYNFRSDHLSVFSGTFKNKWLNLAILWELVLLLLIVYVPFLQVAFKTFALTLEDWGIIVLMALTIIPVLETAKFVLRRIPSH